ncbi:MAG: hypothetical protein AAF487_04045 [Bacteroidota bacterium]
MKMKLYYFIIVPWSVILFSLGCNFNSEEATANHIPDVSVEASMENGYYHGEYKEYIGDRLVVHGKMNEGQKTGVWKTFDENSNLVEVVHYSGDSILHILDLQDFDFELLSNDEFTMLVPKNWRYNSSEAPEHLFSYTKQTDKNFNPSITMTKFDSQGLSLSEFEQIAFQNLIASYEIVKEVERTEVLKNGLNVIRKSYMIKNESLEFGAVSFLFKNLKYDSVLIMTGYCELEDILKYKGVFDEIGISFRSTV